MKNILTIETSGTTCSVALSCSGTILEKYSDELRVHGKILLPFISELLDEMSLTVSDIDIIGISIGPGSFTGLRIGFAITQGLAYAQNISVIPLSSLCAHVHSFKTTLSKDNLSSIPGKSIVVIVDAKMDHFYLGQYIMEENYSIDSMGADIIIKKDRMKSFLSKIDPDLILTDDKSRISGLDFVQTEIIEIFPRAKDLIEITENLFNTGFSISPMNIELAYLREADAWKKSN